jgi:hypothetical protein
MTTDQLESDLREHLATQAANVPAARIATVATRSYQPRRWDRRIPVAVSGLAAAAVAAVLLIDNGAGQRGPAVAHRSAPSLSPTSASATNGPTAASLVIRVAGYTVTLAPGAHPTASGCPGGLNPPCGPAAIGIVTDIPAGARRVTTPNPGKPDAPLVAYLVTSPSGGTVAYLPGVVPDGGSAYLEVDFGNTPYSAAQGFAVPSSISSELGHS